MTETVAALRTLLNEALGALAGGADAPEAERRARAVSALVRAERELSELEATRPANTEQDEEARRAELRRRLAAFAAANGVERLFGDADEDGLG